MKESIQSKPKVYLYLRVATATQFDDAVQRQEKQLREYSERLGYSVVGKSILCGSAADTLEELRRLAIDREYRGDASPLFCFTLYRPALMPSVVDCKEGRMMILLLD